MKCRVRWFSLAPLMVLLLAAALWGTGLAQAGDLHPSEETAASLGVLPGFWHAAPDFAGGVGESYGFFAGGWLYEHKDGDGSLYTGEWDIPENHVLALTLWKEYDGITGERCDEEMSFREYGMEYIAQDSATGRPALVINNQKFWKMNKPLDVIGGRPFYLNYESNLTVQDYLDRKAVQCQNPGSAGEDWMDTIILYGDSDLYAFAISLVGFDDSFSPYFGDILFSLDVLPADAYVEYKTTIPETMPLEAVSFTDSDGVRHSYLLAYNGKDGSTCAIPYEISERE